MRVRVSLCGNSKLALESSGNRLHIEALTENNMWQSCQASVGGPERSSPVDLILAIRRRHSALLMQCQICLSTRQREIRSMFLRSPSYVTHSLKAEHASKI